MLVHNTRYSSLKDPTSRVRYDETEVRDHVQIRLTWVSKQAMI
jgi:hypothetical protein